MKQVLPWLVAVGCLGVAVGAVLKGQGSQAATGSAPMPQIGQPAGSVLTGEENVVHRFESDAEIQEFANLWQPREGVRLRMAILQGYWNGEQGVLAQVTDQLNSDYDLDSNQNYFLDSEQRVLREQPTPAAEGQEATGEGKVVYTFTDDAGLQGFTSRWQQQQGTRLRMAVLETYWNQEQARLAQLNNQLAEAYGVDPAKNYAFDGDRRALVERPTPSAPTQPAGTDEGQGAAQPAGTQQGPETQQAAP